MRLLIIITLLAFATPSFAWTQIIIRTLPGKTLGQAANQIKNYMGRNNISAAKYEDQLGECMTPPVKSSSGIWYVRIIVPDNLVDNIQAVMPSATTCELVQVGSQPYEIEPGRYIGQFAQ